MDFRISKTYLSIDGVDYNDAFYPVLGRPIDMHEVTDAGQEISVVDLGDNNYDWATAVVIGGPKDGLKITTIRDIIHFETEERLKEYLKVQLEATDVTITNYYDTGIVVANGADSSYTWAIPEGATYAPGSSPSDSGYLGAIPTPPLPTYTMQFTGGEHSKKEKKLKKLKFNSKTKMFNR